MGPRASRGALGIARRRHPGKGAPRGPASRFSRRRNEGVRSSRTPHLPDRREGVRDSLRERIGVGAALLEAALEEARRAGCRRAWLVTTNDNLPAVRFYQKRGWRIRAIRPGAIRESRRQKPEIPEMGVDGIPIRDEIELELPLADS